MIWVAHEVLASGPRVVLNCGCLSADERYAIRVIAETAGADFTLEYVYTSEEERRRRAATRWLEAPNITFEMTDADPTASWRPSSSRARRARQRTDPIHTAWTQHLAGLGKLAQADIASDHFPG